MADYFLDLDSAARDPKRKVAWCTSVGPAELLLALGFEVYYPENHSAMLGAARMATDFIPYANALGYAPEICSYLTADVGAFLQGVTPLTKAYGIGAVPTPDVLVYNTNQCRDVQDWFMWYARRFDVPCVGIHTHRNLGPLGKEHVDSIAAQLHALVPPLEEIAARRLDMEVLKAVIGRSRRCSDLWERVLMTGAQRPSALTFFDGTIHMGPAVVLRGTQAAIDYYEALAEELETRVRRNEGALERERYRVFWEGMPIWGKLRDMSQLFAELDTCVVASTYCNSWIFTQLDEDDPFGSMARAYTELFIARSDAVKESVLADMCGTYQVDGLVFHDARTCPNNSNCRYGMPQRLQQELGLPFVTINGDLNDLRCYSEEQARTSIEAFIEQLDQG